MGVEHSLVLMIAALLLDGSVSRRVGDAAMLEAVRAESLGFCVDAVGHRSGDHLLPRCIWTIFRHLVAALCDEDRTLLRLEQRETRAVAVPCKDLCTQCFGVIPCRP